MVVNKMERVQCIHFVAIKSVIGKYVHYARVNVLYARIVSISGICDHSVRRIEKNVESKPQMPNAYAAAHVTVVPFYCQSINYRDRTVF